MEYREEQREEIEHGIYCLYQHFKTFWRQATLGEKADFGEPCAECEKYRDGSCNLDWNAKIKPISPEGGFNPRLKVRPDRLDTCDPAEKKKLLNQRRVTEQFLDVEEVIQTIEATYLAELDSLEAIRHTHGDTLSHS